MERLLVRVRSPAPAEHRHHAAGGCVAPTRRVWAAAPAIAAEHMRRAGRAKICRFTAPPPDRISYLIAPQAVELPREAALFLEDLRWELQQHPDVTVYF